MKTDNHNEVGLHVWERAGLGKAPFTFVFFEVKRYVACQGAPSQPGGTCSYCGAALFNCCTVRDANDKRFIVGPDCIAKCGEEGVLEAYKRSPEYRKHQRELRHAREAEQTRELSALLDVWAVELKLAPHPYGYVDRRTGVALTAWDYIQFRLSGCGASGRGAILRAAKKAIAENRQPFGLVPRVTLVASI